MRIPFLFRWLEAQVTPLLLKAHIAFHGRRKPLGADSVKVVGLLASAPDGRPEDILEVVRELKRSIPLVQVNVFAFNSDPEFEQVLCDEVAVKRLNVWNPLVSTLQIRGRKFDLFVDTSTSSRINAPLMSLTRTRLSVGFDVDGQNRHFAFDVPVKYSPAKSALQNYKELLVSAGLPIGTHSK